MEGAELSELRSAFACFLPYSNLRIRDKNFGALVMVAAEPSAPKKLDAHLEQHDAQVFGPVGCIIVAHFIAAVVREQERHLILAQSNPSSIPMLHSLSVICPVLLLAVAGEKVCTGHPPRGKPGRLL